MIERNVKSKSDHIDAYREASKELVLKGEMSIDVYLMKVCGVSEARVPALRDIALAHL